MSIPIEYLLFKISILKKCSVIILLISAISILFKQGGFALGCFIGGFISIFIFLLLYKYVLVLKDLSPPQRKKFFIPRSLLIYAIMGLTLFIAIKKGIPVFLGTALGLLSLKLAIFTEVFKKRKCQLTSS